MAASLDAFEESPFADPDWIGSPPTWATNPQTAALAWQALCHPLLEKLHRVKGCWQPDEQGDPAPGILAAIALSWPSNPAQGFDDLDWGHDLVLFRERLNATLALLPKFGIDINASFPKAMPTDTGPAAKKLKIRNLSLLHAAAASGCLPAVRLLVEHGADDQVVDSDGCTPLQLAQREGHDLVALYLRVKNLRAQLENQPAPTLTETAPGQ
jgi:hypothetical protein